MRGDEGMSDEPKVGDALDERIDAALQKYMKAPEFSDPSVVLARVRMRAEQEPERRRWSVWAWTVPAAVTALIALAALVRVAHTPTAPQIAFVPKAPGVATVGAPDSGAGEGKNAGPSIPVARATSAQDDRALRASVAVHGHMRRNAAHVGSNVALTEQQLPKLEVFPTPEPLSAEERALLTLATKAPPEVRKQVIEAQQHVGDAIEIAALKILPLRAEQQTRPGKDLP